MRQILRSAGAGLAIAIVLAGHAVGQEDEVLLESAAGDASIKGTIVGFEDGVYSLETAIGLLQIDSATVICTGEACPGIGPPAVAVAVGAGALEEPMFTVIEAFASGIGAEAIETDPAETGRRVALQQGGETVAEFTLRTVDSRLALDEAAWSEAGIDIALIAQPADAGWGGQQYGRDGVVGLVHPDNPVGALTAEDLAGVLAGTLSDWSQLGGPEAAVEVILPPGGSLAAAAVGVLLGPAAGGVETAELPEIPALVAENPAALGITLWSGRGKGARALGLAGPCDAVAAASDFAIGSGAYPLSAEIVIRTRSGDMPEIAANFADHLREDSARSVLVGRGLPARWPVVALPVGEQGDHLVRSVIGARNDEDLETLQALFADLAGARQLSAVYRFGSNAVRARPDHARLTAALNDYLTGLDPEGTEIFLHGYSDALETSRRRVGLSRARAEYVRNLILEAAPEFGRSLRTEAVRDLAPRGCNRNAGGRSLNRRVEVWIRDAG